MNLLSSILLFFIINNLSYAQTWHSVGCLKPMSSIYSLYEYNNELIAGMSWGPCNLSTSGIARFNGNNWLTTNASTIYGVPMDFVKYNNVLLVVGDFQSVDNIPYTSKMAVWDGNSSWAQLSAYTTGTLTTDVIYATAYYKDKVYVGGRFLSIGGTSYKYIAAWNDTSWSSVGGGLTGGGSASTGIYCMEEYMGDLIVAGVFGKMGTTLANNIARWDGSSWHALAGGVDGMVTSLCVDSVNNFLYVGGGIFNADTVSVLAVAGWNGSNWFAPGKGITNGARSMTMFNNELYVGGQSADCNDTALAKWDGNNWFKVAGPCGTVNALSVYKGNLFVGGYFPSVIGDTTMKYLACYGDSCPLSVNTTNISTAKSFLGNNIPNPARGTTIIPYNLPMGKDGTIKLHSINGVLKKQYSVSPESKNLEIDTTGWQKGTYIYSLYIDGKQVESRKMVVN